MLALRLACLRPAMLPGNSAITAGGSIFVPMFSLGDIARLCFIENQSSLSASRSVFSGLYDPQVLAKSLQNSLVSCRGRYSLVVGTMRFIALTVP